jgi:hypothetical protein
VASWVFLGIPRSVADVLQKNPSAPDDPARCALPPSAAPTVPARARANLHKTAGLPRSAPATRILQAAQTPLAQSTHLAFASLSHCAGIVSPMPCRSTGESHRDSGTASVKSPYIRSYYRRSAALSEPARPAMSLRHSNRTSLVTALTPSGSDLDDSRGPLGSVMATSFTRSGRLS